MKAVLLILALVAACLAVATVDDATVTEYYQYIDMSLEDVALKEALQNLTQNHHRLSYKDLWQAYNDMDEEEAAGEWKGTDCPAHTIVDMYSAKCWTPMAEKCGSYRKEGDCYNREHSWPKSWWGGFNAGQGAQTDLFHLFPVDGWVNGHRSSFPFGNVDGTIKMKSTSGALLGESSDCGGCYVFEPMDEFKGDFARGYFYLSTTYMDKWRCCDTEGTNGSSIKPWMEKVLKQWHKDDPVSEKEHHRNNQIFKDWQHNRNPFIDFPQLVDQISDF